VDGLFGAAVFTPETTDLCWPLRLAADICQSLAVRTYLLSTLIDFVADFVADFSRAL